MPQAASRSFVYAFAIVLAVGLLGVLAANMVVDPFRRFDILTIPGINLQRPEFSSNARMGKAGAVCRIQPQAVIMGTSRAEVGLDPKHPGFGGKRTYNLALAAMGIGELEQTLRHAVHASPQLKQAVIALDFLMFNAHREAVVFRTEVLNFDPNRLLLSADDSCASKFIKDADRLIGFSGIRYVDETIRAQKPEEEGSAVDTAAQANWWSSLYDNRGFRGDNYGAAITSLAARSGTRFFYQNDASTQETYYVNKIWRAGPEHRYCFAKDGQPNTLEVFRQLIRLGRQARLDIRFVINPVHARMLLTIQEAGLWPQYEQWKRLLVKELSNEAAKNGVTPYPLWDFSGFNSITTETAPPENPSRKIAQWFWEPSHYRKETGDLMLNKVLNHRDPGQPQPGDFGVLLSAANINAWLTKTREAGKAYAAMHDAEVVNLKVRLAPLFADWTGANCGEEIPLVNEAAKAVGAGNMASGEQLIAKARTIRYRDQSRAAELGVPFREPDLEPLIAAARTGIGVDAPLDNWQAYQERAKTRMSQQDVRGAVNDYSSAIKESPPNPALYFLRGQAKTQLEDFSGAVEDFSAGLKIDPKNVVLYFLRGSAKMHLNDYRSAAGDFETGLTLDPDNSPLKAMLAQARAGRNAPPAPSPDSVAGNVVKDAMSWQAYQERGNSRFAAGDWSGATDDYTAALRTSPPNPALYFLRGRTKMQMDDFSGAVSDFEAGLKLDPANKPLKAMLVQARMGRSAPPPSPDSVAGNVVKDTMSWQAYQERGNSRFAAGDWSGAMDDYTGALRTSPPNPALYFLRGRTKMQMDDFSGAARDFEAGLKLDPANGPLKAMLAAATEKTRNTAK